jgi:hypothetical protein
METGPFVVLFSLHCYERGLSVQTLSFEGRIDVPMYLGHFTAEYLTADQ